MVRRVKPLREVYRPYLIGLMRLKDGVDYPKDHQFSRQQLAAVTPDHVVAFFNLKVYGTAQPTEDANPTNGRSNSIAFAKKAISFFMPNRLMQWNELSDPPAGLGIPVFV